MKMETVRKQMTINNISIFQANLQPSLSILLAVTIQIIATERIRFEIVCAQSQEENLRWGFQDVSKVS